MADKTSKDAAAVQEKIAAMRSPYGAMGARVHAAIMSAAPMLKPRVWYGMPGYALDGPVLCFFRVDELFMTFGLTEKAHFSVADDATDQLMGSAWFFTSLDKATEERIAAIVRKATGQ